MKLLAFNLRVHRGDAMQEGKRNPLGAVPFTGIDFAANRQTRVAALRQEGNNSLKVRHVLLLQLADGKVKLNRMAAIARGQLCIVLKPIVIHDVPNTAAGDIALKGIRPVEQDIEHKDATCRIALQRSVGVQGPAAIGAQASPTLASDSGVVTGSFTPVFTPLIGIPAKPLAFYNSTTPNERGMCRLQTALNPIKVAGPCNPR
jgi:hypothetical protein